MKWLTVNTFWEDRTVMTLSDLITPFIFLRWMQCTFADNVIHEEERVEKQLKGDVISVEKPEMESVPEDTPSVGHHDRAKTLVCRPDPCCLPPYSLEHGVLWPCVCLCVWLNAWPYSRHCKYVCFCSANVKKQVLHKDFGSWSGHLTTNNLILTCLSSACLFFFFSFLYKVSQPHYFLLLLQLMLKILWGRETPPTQEK